MENISVTINLGGVLFTVSVRAENEDAARRLVLDVVKSHVLRDLEKFGIYIPLGVTTDDFYRN